MSPYNNYAMAIKRKSTFIDSAALAIRTNFAKIKKRKTQKGCKAEQHECGEAFYLLFLLLMVSSPFYVTFTSACVVDIFPLNPLKMFQDKPFFTCSLAIKAV